MFFKKWSFVFGLLIFLGFVAVFLYKQNPTQGAEVVFLDIGQGNAALFSDGYTNILYDGGPSKSKLSEKLSKHLPVFNRKIDLLVLSHPDKDHIEGAVELLRHFPVHFVLLNDNVSDTPVYEELQKAIDEAKNKGAVLLYPKSGQEFSVGNFKIVTLWPDRSMKASLSNSSSVVLKIYYGKNSVLLSGDLPKEVEKYLAYKEGRALKSDIVLAGHHGSKTSTSKSWIGFANPDFVVISAGKGNSYGHPHMQTLKILEKFKIKVLRTDKQGDIKFKLTGEEVYFEASL